MTASPPPRNLDKLNKGHALDTAIEQRHQLFRAKRAQKLQSQIDNNNQRHCSLRKAWQFGIVVVASGFATVATDGNGVAITAFLGSGAFCSLNLAKCIMSTFNHSSTPANTADNQTTIVAQSKPTVPAL